MRAAVVMLGIFLPMLGVYTVSTQLQNSAHKTMANTPSQPASAYKMRALAGSWGGISKNGIPIRLVVEDVRPEWAMVRFAWGRNPGDSSLRTSVRTRAKILPDGRLCISYPLQLVFALSEDSQSLVGTTVHADPFASVLLTRVGEEWTRTAFSR